MIIFKDFSELDQHQIVSYQLEMQRAFPEVIHQSPVVLDHWERLEKYFPTFQMFLLADDGELIGYMNTIPFRWNEDFEALPQQGWDWLIQRGITDYEAGIEPNMLGGLQVIVAQSYLRQGYSKKLINHGKEKARSLGFNNLVIPIRPIKKSEHPHVRMQDYCTWKTEKGLPQDPWLRTHVESGAEIVKVCSESMQVGGNLDYWQNFFEKPLDKLNEYHITGLLNPIRIDLQQNYGLYQEENVWIKYTL